MKQYFLKGVDVALEFGDTIEFDLFKKGEDGESVTRHIKCKFLPELVPLLLEGDIIEEVEEEEEPKEEEHTYGNDFDIDKEKAWQEVLEHCTKSIELQSHIIKDLAKRVSKLEAAKADCHKRYKYAECPHSVATPPSFIRDILLNL